MAALNILVIGLGYFGESIALELASLGHQVVGVDTDAEVIQRTSQFLDSAYEMDATNLEALRSIDVPNFDICIVGRGSNLEESVLITLNLKELDARHIICKAMTDQQKKILERIGANETVQPERDMGKRLAHMLSTSTKMLDFMSMPGNYGLEEIVAPSAWWGQTLGDLKLPTVSGLMVLLIKSGEKFFPAPSPNTLIKENDILIVFGHYKKLMKFKS